MTTIEHKIQSDESVSTVTVDGVPAFTMGQQHTMLNLVGSGNPILPGAYYGDDYLIREAPDGEILGRWFVQAYGWKRFWPPGANIPRVERLMRSLRTRAKHAQRALADLSAEIVRDASLPNRSFIDGRTGAKETEILVCGLNRYGNVIEYAVNNNGKGDYGLGARNAGVERSPVGDCFAHAADRAYATWIELSRFQEILSDLVLARLRAGKRSPGVHRIVVGEHGYWFRLYFKRERFGKSLTVESLDDYGAGEITETRVKEEEQP